MPIAHEPGCEGFADERGRQEGICQSWCWGHGRCEPLRPGDYLVCGECLHVYRTAADLVAEYADMATRLEFDTVLRDPDQIFACPVCGHDF